MADLTGMLQAAAGSAGGGASTPWELTNATFNGTPWNRLNTQPSGVGGTGRGIYIKDDGTKLYLAEDSGEVHQFDLSVAWNLGSGSFVQSVSVSAKETALNTVFFKSDGTKMYILGSSSDSVHEYALSSAWDISTASFTQTFSVSGKETNPTSLFFKDDGTEMYVSGSISANIHQYSLSSAWDISTASFLQSFSVSSQDAIPYGIFFKSDGTQMFMIGAANTRVYEYSLSTAWDMSTASYITNQTISTITTSPVGLFFKSDGTKMYVPSYTSLSVVLALDLSVAWDISTLSFVFPTTEYFSVATEETNPRGIFFKPDGTIMYICGSTGDDVNEYSLSTAWDISSASYVRAFSVAAQETTPVSVFFKDDGTKMYILGASGDDVNEYSLSSAWNVSTASYVQNFSIASQDTSPNALFFKPDGTKMYMVGNTGQNVNEYNLSTAWDVTSASYVQNFSVASQEPSAPQGLFFKDDGTKMYVAGSTYDEIYEYDLSTAWNISTASYVQSFFVGSQETSPRCMFFKDDGTKLYITGTGSDAVWSFDL